KVVAIDEYTIEVTFAESFRNVTTDLTVKYDRTLGMLNGRDGYVATFEWVITPTGLVPYHNPNIRERVAVQVQVPVVVDVHPVTRKDASVQDTVVVGVTNPATIKVTYAGEIIP